MTEPTGLGATGLEPTALEVEDVVRADSEVIDG